MREFEDFAGTVIQRIETEQPPRWKLILAAIWKRIIIFILVVMIVALLLVLTVPGTPIH